MINRAKEKHNVEFPACASGCPCVEYFGVCECESICPHKFDLKTGAAKKLNVANCLQQPQHKIRLTLWNNVYRPRHRASNAYVSQNKPR